MELKESTVSMIALATYLIALTVSTAAITYYTSDNNQLVDDAVDARTLLTEAYRNSASNEELLTATNAAQALMEPHYQQGDATLDKAVDRLREFHHGSETRTFTDNMDKFDILFVSDGRYESVYMTTSGLGLGANFVVGLFVSALLAIAPALLIASLAYKLVPENKRDTYSSLRDIYEHY